MSEDPVAFLLDDIEEAKEVEILGEDDWSYLFRVTFEDGTSKPGIMYKPTPCLQTREYRIEQDYDCIPIEWELEDR